MTAKELFSRLLVSEQGAFRRVVEALPEASLDYRPHPDSRSAREILTGMLWNPGVILTVLKTGGMKADGGGTPEPPQVRSTKDAADRLEREFKEVVEYLRGMPDEDLDKQASIAGGGSRWTTTRAEMAMGFLLDAIHHRGQLSTYLRPMGAKVPAIYGPSGDSGPVIS
jgi:uncharacterized damage-inducible protein DinB